jgi:2-iminobutanoate/2-iminopropanoate deaminase
MSVPLFHMIAGAPDPVAPFSHAVEVDGWLFVTGQMPFSGVSLDSPYPEGIEAQTRQVMENLKRVLAGCGLGLEHVVAARVFLTHFDEDYERMNAVYASYFASGKRPARTCVGVTALARGARVEIDLIARKAGRKADRSGATARAARTASPRDARSPRRAPAGGRSRRRGR